MVEDLAAQAVNLAAKAEALAAKADDLGWMGSRMIDLHASLQSSHGERVLVDKETGRKWLVANATPHSPSIGETAQGAICPSDRDENKKDVEESEFSGEKDSPRGILSVKGGPGESWLDWLCHWACDATPIYIGFTGGNSSAGSNGTKYIEKWSNSAF